MQIERADGGSEAARALGLALVTATAAGVVAACDGEGAPEAEQEAPPAPEEQGTWIDDAGFAGPESILHDADADVYLVSNINGEPLAEDGNGFISRVDPDGSVAELQWIDGAAEGVTLHAPKGMALLGDELYVADIDCVRVFDRTSGDAVDEICVPDATFLNDIAVDGNDVLYVTDTGALDEEGAGDNPGAIYRFQPGGDPAELTSGPQLGGPNGIAYSPRGLLVVSFRSGEIYRLSADGQKTPVTPQSERQLDGIVFLPDERFYFSSWGDAAVYEVGTDGSVSQVVEGIEGPADIGYDAERDRILVPVLPGDALLFADLGEQGR